MNAHNAALGGTPQRLKRGIPLALRGVARRFGEREVPKGHESHLYQPAWAPFLIFGFMPSLKPKNYLTEQTLYLRVFLSILSF